MHDWNFHKFWVFMKISCHEIWITTVKYEFDYILPYFSIVMLMYIKTVCMNI